MAYNLWSNAMISRLQGTPESAREHFLTAPDDSGAAGIGHALKTMEHVETVGDDNQEQEDRRYV